MVPTDELIIDLVSTGRAGIRLTGLIAGPEFRINDIAIDPDHDGDAILVGLPMAGRWRITGLAPPAVTR